MSYVHSRVKLLSVAVRAGVPCRTLILNAGARHPTYCSAALASVLMRQNSHKIHVASKIMAYFGA